MWPSPSPLKLCHSCRPRSSCSTSSACVTALASSIPPPAGPSARLPWQHDQLKPDEIYSKISFKSQLCLETAGSIAWQPVSLALGLETIAHHAVPELCQDLRHDKFQYTWKFSPTCWDNCKHRRHVYDHSGSVLTPAPCSLYSYALQRAEALVTVLPMLRSVASLATCSQGGLLKHTWRNFLDPLASQPLAGLKRRVQLGGFALVDHDVLGIDLLPIEDHELFVGAPCPLAVPQDRVLLLPADLRQHAWQVWGHGVAVDPVAHGHAADQHAIEARVKAVLSSKTSLSNCRHMTTNFFFSIPRLLLI